MKTNTMAVKVPSFFNRLYSVWFRHMRVYTKHLISNGFPPFLEPIIMFFGIGIGLGLYINQTMDGIPYAQFLATGLVVSAAMFTAAFECSYGTFIRLEFDRVYDGMLSAPITYRDLILGEIIWAGTKGFFFSASVLIVITLLGQIHSPFALLAPLVGFVTGIVFAALSMLITAFVHNINYFNFYFTGFLSPMFFFSGIFFPVSNLPLPLQMISEAIPLTHTVRLARAFCVGNFDIMLIWDGVYLVLFAVVFSYLAMFFLKKRLIG